MADSGRCILKIIHREKERQNRTNEKKNKNICDNANHIAGLYYRSGFLFNISVQAVRTYIFHQRLLSLDRAGEANFNIRCSVSSVDTRQCISSLPHSQ